MRSEGRLCASERVALGYVRPARSLRSGGLAILSGRQPPTGDIEARRLVRTWSRANGIAQRHRASPASQRARGPRPAAPAGTACRLMRDTVSIRIWGRFKCQADAPTYATQRSDPATILSS